MLVVHLVKATMLWVIVETGVTDTMEVEVDHLEVVGVVIVITMIGIGEIFSCFLCAKTYFLLRHQICCNNLFIRLSVLLWLKE